MAKIDDPRRVIISAHSNISNPRAKRWYNIIIAVEFDGEIFPLQHIYGNDGKIISAPSTLSECVKARNAHAKRLGFAPVKGVWRNDWLGKPAMLIGSPNS